MKISEQSSRIHDAAILIDGHNDLPWALRATGDMAYGSLDLEKPLDGFHTDIPRLRLGGVKGQFWSVWIPGTHENPARTVTQQIDLVTRMIERYPHAFELALSARDIERIARGGKIASLIGIEGGIAIENDLAQLRAFHALGARYMTLTHNETIDWADSATDEAKHGGLTPFGERVVREMNRLGMLVDISHVSAATMDDVLRVSRAPVIASHSGAYTIAPHPRNVPDEILVRVKANGGVVMVVFFPGFVDAGQARALVAAKEELRAKYPDPKEFESKYRDWFKAQKFPPISVKDVALHIDHIVKTAGIDHVGVGSDFDGINTTPTDLRDVADFPNLTEELLSRGYSEEDVKKILGGNLLRAFHRAGEIAAELRTKEKPEVDSPAPRS
jgi:membrane dipeptidase